MDENQSEYTQAGENSRKSPMLKVLGAILLIFAVTASYAVFKNDNPSSSAPKTSIIENGSRSIKYNGDWVSLEYPDSVILKEHEDDAGFAFVMKGSDQAGIIFNFHENPKDLPMEDYFSDRGDLFSGTEPENIRFVTIGERDGLSFTPYVTEAGGDIYIIPLDLAFLEIFDRNFSSFNENGILGQILPTIRFRTR